MKLRSLLVAALLACGCGRTLVAGDLPAAKDCVLLVGTNGVDFGLTSESGEVDRQLTLHNIGDVHCTVSHPMISPQSSPGFSLSPGQPTEVGLNPGELTFITLRFAPRGVAQPLKRVGELRFSLNSAAQPTLTVPLKAELSHCALVALAETLDFGPRRDGFLENDVQLENHGDQTCHVNTVALTGDPAFTLPSAVPLPIELPPGTTTTVHVRFTAPTPLVAPIARDAKLTVTPDGLSLGPVVVSLKATLELCVLAVAPSSLDFGVVAVGNAANRSLTIQNVGTGACQVGAVGFAPDSDPGFSVTSGAPVPDLAPQQLTTLALRYSASDNAMLHQRAGTLRLSTNDPAQPTVTTRLSVLINTFCVDQGQLIFTLDETPTLGRLDPKTLTFTPIATVNCPVKTSDAEPIAMMIDRMGVAWVQFTDTLLYAVDTQTGDCTRTGYVPPQHDVYYFTMAEVRDPQSGATQVKFAGYLNSNTNTHVFGTVDLSALQLNPIAPLAPQFGAPRLSGTADGELWGLALGFANRFGGKGLVKLDPASGATLEEYDVSSIRSGVPRLEDSGGIAPVGKEIYVFYHAGVWRVDRSTLVRGQLLPTTPPPQVFVNPLGGHFRAAAISTCVPSTP
jgi:hypothetical protein